MFEDLDHRFGGGHVRTAAVQYLSDTVVPLLAGTYTDVRGRDLAAVVSQFTYKTGAMAYDVGLNGLARRYFVQALNLAHLTDDRALGGKVFALMSHQANHCGEYREALDLARAAKLGAAGQATPTVQAMYSAMEARALASLGDSKGCVRALRDAERSFERRNPADDPDWIGYFDTAELHDEIGHCFVALRQATDAEHHATIALKSAGSTNASTDSTKSRRYAASGGKRHPCSLRPPESIPYSTDIVRQVPGVQERSAAGSRSEPILRSTSGSRRGSRPVRLANHNVIRSSRTAAKVS